MEKGNVKVMMIVALLLVSGTFVQKSEANFAGCFAVCFLGCIVGPKDLPHCSFTCLEKCIVGVTTLSTADRPCVLECAKSSCTNISTAENPAAGDVGKCVGQCRASCAKM